MSATLTLVAPHSFPPGRRKALDRFLVVFVGADAAPEELPAAVAAYRLGEPPAWAAELVATVRRSAGGVDVLLRVPHTVGRRQRHVLNIASDAALHLRDELRELRPVAVYVVVLDQKGEETVRKSWELEPGDAPFVPVSRASVQRNDERNVRFRVAHGKLQVARECFLQRHFKARANPS